MFACALDEFRAPDVPSNFIGGPVFLLSRRRTLLRFNLLTEMDNRSRLAV
jgi:hypothetical protein